MKLCSVGMILAVCFVISLPAIAAKPKDCDRSLKPVSELRGVATAPMATVPLILDVRGSEGASLDWERSFVKLERTASSSIHIVKFRPHRSASNETALKLARLHGRGSQLYKRLQTAPEQTLGRMLNLSAQSPGFTDEYSFYQRSFYESGNNPDAILEIVLESGAIVVRAVKFHPIRQYRH